MIVPRNYQNGPCHQPCLKNPSKYAMVHLASATKYSVCAARVMNHICPLFLPDCLQYISHITSKWQPRFWPGRGRPHVGSLLATLTGQFCALFQSDDYDVKLPCSKTTTCNVYLIQPNVHDVCTMEYLLHSRDLPYRLHAKFVTLE